ncbi:hypothetical protein BDZ89DRAFT_1016892 [Hymenopellis radicata]|nr:hypothetical protein BDZ89DRAFT_1016892 [Hymenopellis radicata]
MSDLAYCYLHMTDYELKALDTLDTPSYLNGILSDDDIVLPADMIPPNPEEHDNLPSQTHPSYPFGNPTNIKHPASKPRPFSAVDPRMQTRALYEDMSPAPTTVEMSVRWRELALETLLPPDEEKAQAEKALDARRMANGVPSNNPGQPGAPVTGDDDDSSDDGDEEEEDDDDEEESTDEEETDEEDDE